MKTIQGVFRNGKIEALDDVKAPDNTKLLIVVTDEVVPEAVASQLRDVTVVEKIRRRVSSEVTAEQQIGSRQKLKQIASQLDGKLPFESPEDAGRSARERRHADD